jgi:hypothetical protein
MPDFSNLPVPPAAVRGLVDPPTELPITFDPVPRQRQRRNGWSEERQRAFIDVLAEFGCVTTACQAVGMSTRSAYRLLDAPGADGFAEAWDKAIAWGIENLRAEAFDRVMNGLWVPVMRKGRIVRHERRLSDRLAIALLSGRRMDVLEHRERAASRRKYRLFLAEERAKQAEEKRQADAIRAEHQVILDRIEEEKRNPVPMNIRCPPRVRML